ncbi:MAG: DUF1801 domain-containing protein [Daejeonella sp.]
MTTRNTTPAVKRTLKKPGDAEQVTAYMLQLEHPLKAEIEALRVIIKNASAKIAERIKWSAPSYYITGADLLTFNPRSVKRVHLVFHHEAIVRIKSDLLEGDYKDRRMVYFKDMAEVETRKKEFERIIDEYVNLAENAANPSAVIPGK